MTRLTTHNSRRTTLIQTVLLFLLLIISCWSLVSVNIAHAQNSTEYKLLTPLPIGPNNTNAEIVTAETYIPGIIMLIIGIAGVLAVVKIIFGGIQYMSTDAIGGKSEGKTHITNALWGLLLIISAYIILFTINPNLVNLNLEIKGLRIGGAFETGLGNASSTTGSGLIGPSYGLAWENDTDVRSTLKSMGIDVKEPTCQTIGQTGCTSVYGLHPNVISGLGILVKDCECEFTVTGGTEYWLHGNRSTEARLNGTDHMPRIGNLGGSGGAVDLRKQSMSKLTSFIESKAPTSGSGCSSLGKAYSYKNGIYVNEGDHWHVCFK